MYKLTFKNLRKFHKINTEAKYERTPTPSESSELNDMYHLADALCASSTNNNICNIKYIKIAEQLDTLPLVSKEFRDLLMQDGFEIKGFRNT